MKCKYCGEEIIEKPICPSCGKYVSAADWANRNKTKEQIAKQGFTEFVFFIALSVGCFCFYFYQLNYNSMHPFSHTEDPFILIPCIAGFVAMAILGLKKYKDNQ